MAFLHAFVGKVSECAAESDSADDFEGALSTLCEVTLMHTLAVMRNDVDQHMHAHALKCAEKSVHALSKVRAAIPDYSRVIAEARAVYTAPMDTTEGDHFTEVVDDRDHFTDKVSHVCDHMRCDAMAARSDGEAFMRWWALVM